MKINTVKASTTKPNGKPQSVDKLLGIEPDIRFYEIEDVEKGKEAEILVIHDLRLVETKKNIIKRKFPYIDTFNHRRPDVVRMMRDLPIEVFEHLEKISPLDVDKGIKYMQRIIRGMGLNKYKQILAECKDSDKGIAGDHWALVTTYNVTM